MSTWPSLPYSEWNDTLDTLHMWMQIVGKVKLAFSPFRNQWWEAAFYLTPQGITTGRIPYRRVAFAVDFDFIAQSLHIVISDGQRKTISLKSFSVSYFYKIFMEALLRVGIQVSINTNPVEFIDPVAFTKDIQHKSYDQDAVLKCWQIMLQTSFVFDRFQTSFRGKSSPIQFFWGSFDLACTRFSGKRATPPKLKGAMGKIMKFAENEENFTFGFWPGDKKFPYPAFYSYLYPLPKGCEKVMYFNKTYSGFLLPYEKVRKVKNPEKVILHFLKITYMKSSQLAGWNVDELEGPVPR